MNSSLVTQLSQKNISFLDLLPYQDLREKLVGLALKDRIPETGGVRNSNLRELQQQLRLFDTEDVRVVVFGGGSGLSNIIGGDSRRQAWKRHPFGGVKAQFPATRSVVCVTDNGGSTGELLKDLDLIAIGDIRHVLLSSIQKNRLQKIYNLNSARSLRVANLLYEIFNKRYLGPLQKDGATMAELTGYLEDLPVKLSTYLKELIYYLFTAQSLRKTLKRDHCFGNLLIAAAIFHEKDHGIIESSKKTSLHRAIAVALNRLAILLGASQEAVMPCTSTPAQLNIRYTNGVEIAGEHKLINARRGFPVDSALVSFSEEPRVYEEVLDSIRNADILVLAPGSLYSSIIPIFRVPRIAQAVRANRHALKILISNLWVQTGETDLSIADPQRKFHVSDMVDAYEKNIPGGIDELFDLVLCVSLNDVPASILQRYAVENKIPIYLDREELTARGLYPVECEIYSKSAINERGVIQHDQDSLALAIKVLYQGYVAKIAGFEGPPSRTLLPGPTKNCHPQGKRCLKPCKRFAALQEKFADFPIEVGAHQDQNDLCLGLREKIKDIFWDNPTIPLAHLQYFKGLECIDKDDWRRDQKWDNVFSFFDPVDFRIKIRTDQIQDRRQLELGLLIAVGESLLGNYALKKKMQPVVKDGFKLGRIYHLYLAKERISYFSQAELQTYLKLARMNYADAYHYTRLVNHEEGFTPPGLLMGLMYAWYVDNLLASHIEYKMSLMRIRRSDLIPEQLRMAKRRREMIDFFREVVFRTEPP